MQEPVVVEFDCETYLMWEERQRDRFELHHGFVVAFAGGTLDHDRISLNLRNAFDRLFPPPRRAFGSDVKVRADETTFYYADAGVVCGDVNGSLTEVAEPRIVAEVLSPRTRAYDMIERRDAYRKIATLDAYVIVHTDRRRVELDLRDTRERWVTTLFEGEPLPPGNASLALEDIYSRTSLASP